MKTLMVASLSALTAISFAATPVLGSECAEIARRGEVVGIYQGNSDLRKSYTKKRRCSKSIKSTTSYNRTWIPHESPLEMKTLTKVASSKEKVVEKKKKKTTKKPGKTIIKRTVRKTTTAPKVVAKVEEESGGGLNLAPVVGCAHFTLSGNLIKNAFTNTADHGPGLMAGALAEFRSAKGLFGLESGLLFVQHGADATDGSISASQGKLDYVYSDSLYIPLNAKMYLIRKHSFELVLRAGVMVGFLMTSDIGVTTTGSVRSEQEFKDSLKNNDFLGNVGIGARVRLTSETLIGLDATYNRSLTSISDTNPTALAAVAGGTTVETSDDAYNEGVVGMVSLIVEI